MNLTELAVKTVYWFFLYGFIGWGVEVVYAAVKTHALVNRGFLCGPICPIYGFGACMGCTIDTVNGPKRVCREGPVFGRDEIKW